MRWPEPGRVTEIIEKVAREIVLPAAARGISDTERRHKAQGEIVTDFDVAAEEMLSAELFALTPDFTILGEEAVAADPERLNLLKGDVPVWVIDPIDGTANFARGSPVYGMIVSLIYRGETVAGWIYDPPSGRMAIAEKGQGAAIDGEAPELAGDAPVESLAGMPGYKLLDSISRKQFAERINRFRRVEILGCAAHQYLRLLTGTDHFAASRRTKPWDHAAGVLMMQEAGAVVRRVDGQKYHPASFDPPMIAAASENVWQRVYEVLTQ